MLLVTEPESESTARRIVLCSVLLIPISLLPSLLGMAGIVYSVTATWLAAWGLFTSERGWGV